MKRIALLALITNIAIFTLSAQTPPVTQYLYKFSPLAEIIARNLGLIDKNGNGVIDKDANEGYEQFIEKYGTGGTFAEKEKSIDCGFHANYVMYGTGNAKLEENEIVNYYYLTIRFKHAEETAVIDNEIKTYIYANDIPLVWLDDEQGTVMNAVNQILGEGWNEKEVTENEAVTMFFRVLQQMRIRGRTGNLGKTEYYYTLPEFVTKKAGFCTEAAQFGFWFFSELKINSVSAWTALTSSTLHDVLKLSSGRIVDYFGSSNRYNIPNDRWLTENPLLSTSEYYRAMGELLDSQALFEKTFVYDKYDMSNIAKLMYIHRRTRNFNTVIELGEFFMQNSDIDKILSAGHLESAFVKEQIKSILIYLFASYNETDNRSGNDRIVVLLKKYYARDKLVNDWLKFYGQ